MLIYFFSSSQAIRNFFRAIIHNQCVGFLSHVLVLLPSFTFLQFVALDAILVQSFPIRVSPSMNVGLRHCVSDDPGQGKSSTLVSMSLVFLLSTISSV